MKIPRKLKKKLKAEILSKGKIDHLWRRKDLHIKGIKRHSPWDSPMATVGCISVTSYTLG
jgi:hypothetical protein